MTVAPMPTPLSLPAPIKLYGEQNFAEKIIGPFSKVLGNTLAAEDFTSGMTGLISGVKWLQEEVPAWALSTIDAFDVFGGLVGATRFISDYTYFSVRKDEDGNRSTLGRTGFQEDKADGRYFKACGHVTLFASNIITSARYLESVKLIDLTKITDFATKLGGFKTLGFGEKITYGVVGNVVLGLGFGFMLADAGVKLYKGEDRKGAFLDALSSASVVGMRYLVLTNGLTLGAFAAFSTVSWLASNTSFLKDAYEDERKDEILRRKVVVLTQVEAIDQKNNELLACGKLYEASGQRNVVAEINKSYRLDADRCISDVRKYKDTPGGLIALDKLAGRINNLYENTQLTVETVNTVLQQRLPGCVIKQCVAEHSDVSHDGFIDHAPCVAPQALRAIPAPLTLRDRVEFVLHHTAELYQNLDGFDKILKKVSAPILIFRNLGFGVENPSLLAISSETNLVSNWVPARALIGRVKCFFDGSFTRESTLKKTSIWLYVFTAGSASLQFIAARGVDLPVLAQSIGSFFGGAGFGLRLFNFTSQVSIGLLKNRLCALACAFSIAAAFKGMYDRSNQASRSGVVGKPVVTIKDLAGIVAEMGKAALCLYGSLYMTVPFGIYCLMTAVASSTKVVAGNIESESKRKNLYAEAHRLGLLTA
jgi:hypothetical protein